MLLNVHSSYSLLNSTLQIDDYIKTAKAYGYTALGLADLNHLHGALTFQTQCVAHELKPLIGMTLVLAGLEFGEKDFPIILYAKNQQGYEGLLKVSRLINQPSSSHELIWHTLKAYRTHLVAITPGRSGEIEQTLIHHNDTEAVRVLQRLLDIFGKDDFYVGVPIYPYNSIEINRLVEFANRYQIKTVVNQLVQTLEAKDYFSLKVLQAIHNNEQVDVKMQEVQGSTYLFDQQGLQQLYIQANLAAVLENTKALINTKLNFKIQDHQQLLPKFHPPQGTNSKIFLQQLTRQQLEKIGKHQDNTYLERLNYEISVIAEMGFIDYFLIVWEIVRYCHQNDIRVGPGRGSAAGSLIAYLLEITLVDPIEFDLYFERFLNPERQSMPDIDIDIADNQRDQVLRYVEQHYGHENVAQIATFGTFGAKQAMRDTLRVLGEDADGLRRWSRAIPSELNITLTAAYEQSPLLQRIVNQNLENKEKFAVALTIEGLPRHVSTHAAGIVINDFALDTVVPVTDRPEQMLITQFAMDDIEQMGLLKMDLLGLRNLSLLENILTAVQRRHGYYLNVRDLPQNDPRVLAIFQQANTNGVFQFESAGIKNVLRKVHPTSFEDIVAVNALFRPGPMRQIDSFVRRKHGQEAIQYLHPTFEKILSRTYGIIVYQEQVMQVVQEMAGFSLGEADILRRAMSQKEQALMIKEKQHFIDGATARGVSLDVATQVFDYVAEFASYGFNRSHAVVYSTLAYQLAYLKAYYPLEFYQEILNSVQGQTQTFNEYFHEASQRLGQIQSIDINQSSLNFTIHKDQLVAGFGMIKGMRKDFVQKILEIRQHYGPYQSLLDFLQKIPTNFLKEELITPLIAVGVFDSLGYNRATYVHNLASLIQGVEFSGNNLSLFGEVEPKINEVADWTLVEKLNQEIEWMGLSLSGHPLDEYAYLYQENTVYKTIKETMALPKQSRVQMFGMVQKVRTIKTKKNDTMAFVTLSQPEATIALVVFPRAYAQYSQYLQENLIVELVGKTDLSQRGEEQIIVDHLRPLVVQQTAPTVVKGRCFIRVQTLNPQDATFAKAKDLAQKYPGHYQIILVDHQRNTWQLADQWLIDWLPEAEQELRQFFGNDNVVFQKNE